MKVELLVRAGSGPCERAERIWREVATAQGIELVVVNLADRTGSELATQPTITAVPAVLIDGQLAAVGVQSPEEARALVSGHGINRPR
ncbi:MAG: thioredoxin family protein [Pseudomonadota bacterium]|nr:MAG: thioredoxin family protein [Pseudomonadota bacterium]